MFFIIIIIIIIIIIRGHVVVRSTQPPTEMSKLRGLSPHANYTDRAAAAGRRS